jgi:CubicO group peptidase (beta-lactamase class C family)
LVLGAHVRFVIALLLLLAAAPVAPAAAQDAPAAPASWPTTGWRVAAPGAHGFDPQLLAAVDQRLAADAPLLSAFVVVKGGEIAYERYGEGYDPQRPFHTWSVTKSITNIAVGLALEEGLIGSLDQTLGELIPDRIPPGADPRVADITLEHLLTMTGGWAWDGRVNFARFVETDDLDLMLARPLVCDPGACFEYDSGSSNLLAYVVERQSGQLMADYLQPRLFAPLGIDRPSWLVTDDGACRGGGGAFLTPREMAKIGYLYLNGGVWDGRQIVSREWVERSTRPHASGVGYASGSNIGGGSYGYHWWVAETAAGPAAVAFGYGGQYIYVVPSIDLVVVTGYAETDPTRPDLQQYPRPAIEELIIPAALAQGAAA